jgi:hypothetical protein
MTRYFVIITDSGCQDFFTKSPTQRFAGLALTIRHDYV